MNIKTTLWIWTISFVVAAISMVTFSWVFFVSAAVFILSSMYISHEQRRFENDLDDMFGKDDSFE